jgi:predicted nucleic acid-binding protein
MSYSGDKGLVYPWPRAAFSHAEDRGETPPIAVSVALALEYEDVLLRPSMLAQSWASADQISAVLDSLLANATLAQPIQVRRRPAFPDPGDDLVVECALEARADAIVTTNLRDFTGVTETFGVRLLRPGDLVAELRKADP